MSGIIKPGVKVWYYHDGFNRYNKIVKIVYTLDGLSAVFEDKLCLKDTYTIPIEDLYLTKQEYFNSRKNNLTKT